MRATERGIAVAAVVAAASFVAGLWTDSLALRVVAKPWPALVLAAWAVRQARDGYATRIATALVLCAVADVLLEFRDRTFVHGMAVFLLAQLTLASAFTARSRDPRPWAALPFAVWLGAVLATVWPALGTMRVPVLAYVAAIGVMLWRAAAWAAADASRAARTALAGAVIFGVSDSLIALDRFHAPIAGARYLVIATYWSALLLLASTAAPLRPRRG